MDRLLIATTNPGKLREIQFVLAGVPPALLTLNDLPPIAEPEETGLTFADNARLKAEYYAQAAGLHTVAEDSGLEIDALGGRPGVLSARYPGDTYAEKFANLYRELAGHRRPWTARFVCSVAIVAAPGSVGMVTADPPPGAGGSGRLVFQCESTVEGEIAAEPRGEYGFGYDPIFFYPPYGCTLGEVTGARKLAVAHRGRAFRRVADWLNT